MCAPEWMQARYFFDFFSNTGYPFFQIALLPAKHIHNNIQQKNRTL